VSEAGLGPGDVRVGPAYEAERAEARSSLAATSAARRVELGGGLVLVFEDRERVRVALEEMLRSQRVTDPERVATETAVFAELLPGEQGVTATLYVDLGDPAALADRLAELAGIAAALTLEVGEDRVVGSPEDGDAEAGAARVVFRLDRALRDRIGDGTAVSVSVDHPALRTRVPLGDAQLRALAAA
jgi:hypothetical protein